MNEESFGASISKVWFCTIGAITVSQVIGFFNVLAPALAAAYTLWKWYKEAKASKNEPDQNKPN